MRRALTLGTLLSAVAAAAAAQRAALPPVTVADVIGLTLFGSDAHNGAIHDVHVLSPDGRRVAVVVQTGNLARNTVDYALLVLSTDPAAPRLDTVAALASSSNEPAISNVMWVDEGTLAFLGARPAGVPQVLSVDLATRTLTSRTHSATGVTSFLMGPGADPLIYQEGAALDTADYAALRAHGFAIDRHVWPSDLIMGDLRGAVRHAEAPSGYRILRQGRDTPLALPDSTSGYAHCTIQPYYGPPLSPAGDALLLGCAPRTIPALWGAYRNPRYRLFADHFAAPGEVLVLLDLASGRARRVYDAPLMVQWETNWAWAPDGRSLLLSDALLPLSGSDSARRLTQRVAAELDLRSGAITVVTPRDSLIVQSWDAATGVVEFARGPTWFQVNDDSPRAFFRKTGRGWEPSARAGRTQLRVTQDANTPPRLVAADPRSGSARLVLDPNPGLLTRHNFGRVTIFHWTTKTGKTYAGGLYLPPDYVPGRRYPLVLQTHGYDSTLFAPEGGYTTGSAAQPLAGAGVLVLQTAEQVGGDRTNVTDTPGEGPDDQDMLEGAIDALDHQGMIDRDKVGLQGFSRTCFVALYFLTHSTYRVAAADLSDGVDYSYLQYLVYGGAGSERMNGGRPWGPTHAQWLERAAGFRLDRVTAPLRLTAIGAHSVLQEWEPYAGLLAQGRPTELVYIPEGSHLLVKPWERMTSQQGAVDWYRFWLQNYEDPDSAKTEQYARWRRLRAQRDSSPVSISR
jgi:dipeptidyl aminopeptidase/acylaminoacyl peptidase